LIDLTAYCPQPVKRERRAFLSKLPRVAPGRFTGNEIRIFRIENPRAQFRIERIPSKKNRSPVPGSILLSVELSSLATS